MLKFLLKARQGGNKQQKGMNVFTLLKFSETRCKAEYQYIERSLLGGEIFYKDKEGAVIIYCLGVGWRILLLL